MSSRKGPVQSDAQPPAKGSGCCDEQDAGPAATRNTQYQKPSGGPELGLGPSDGVSTPLYIHSKTGLTV